MIRIYRSKLKYEFHKKPKVQKEKYPWGVSIEIKFLKYRLEFKTINKKIADEIEAENELMGVVCDCENIHDICVSCMRNGYIA